MFILGYICVICAINDVSYNETHLHETLLGIYSLNVIKLSNDIYIEVTDWTEGELHMTIHAKKIISKLSISLENMK